MKFLVFSVCPSFNGINQGTKFYYNKILETEDKSNNDQGLLRGVQTTTTLRQDKKRQDTGWTPDHRFL